MNPLAIKAIICAIIALGSFLGGFWAGSLVGDARVSELEKNQATEREEAAISLSQEVLVNELGKAKLAKQTQDNLDLIGRQPAPVRVQLPSALCADYGQADTTGSGQQAGQANGVLLAEAERILAADRQRTYELITEAEVELTNCREVKGWAAGF
jgi:hypothetical protein